MSLSAQIANVESGLIAEALRFADYRARGLADLDVEYAKYSADFKTTMAGESKALARKAGVPEKAAFLALMQLLDM